jgi:adenylate cyclase
MLRIVQYEVYALHEGRWTLHARYPGAERDDALDDARRTEGRTGYPTKVVRDTYYRDLNYSEETVTYLSPRAKKSVQKGSIEIERNDSPRHRSPKTEQLYRNSASESAGHAPTSTPVSGGTFFTRLVWR